MVPAPRQLPALHVRAISEASLASTRCSLPSARRAELAAESAPATLDEEEAAAANAEAGGSGGPPRKASGSGSEEASRANILRSLPGARRAEESAALLAAGVASSRFEGEAAAASARAGSSRGPSPREVAPAKLEGEAAGAASRGAGGGSGPSPRGAHGGGGCDEAGGSGRPSPRRAGGSSGPSPRGAGGSSGLSPRGAGGGGGNDEASVASSRCSLASARHAAERAAELAAELAAEVASAAATGGAAGTGAEAADGGESSASEGGDGKAERGPTLLTRSEEHDASSSGADTRLDVKIASDDEGESAERRKPSRWNTRVTLLVDRASLCLGWDGLNDATFKDLRWENAQRYLREDMLCEGEGWAKEVLRHGAKSFGLFDISDLALEALARQLEAAESKVSPPLEAWIFQFRASCHEHDSEALSHTLVRCTRNSDSRTKTCLPIKGRSGNTSFTALDVREFVQNRLSSPWKYLRRRKLKLALLALILLISLLIVVPKGPSIVVETFGWPLVVARLTGVGTLLGTSVLFLTMSRTLLNFLYACIPASLETRFLDQHTPLHAFCGKMVLVFGVIHTVAHLFSTYQAFRFTPPQELNRALKCSEPNRPTEGLLKHVPYLRWPRCPIERNYSYAESLVMTPGVTGIALFTILLLMAWTSCSVAKVKYERFWSVHNWGMWLWFIFLFIHGTQDWFGIGVPLVVPVCTVPASFYLVDRVLRVVRFYLFKNRLSIVSVVIRPGKDGGPGNAMTALEISKPPFLWSLQEGMYAYLCIPEISRWEWHPFTICSCREDDTVDFIIQGVGDWTRELCQRCLDLRNGLQPPPVVALDGPFAAPVTTALASQVLIAVGAGVGITPFLSLLATIIAALGESGGQRGLPLQEAHFFWIARSGDEFLFGRRHFTRIATRAGVREKVFLHLHLTTPLPENDAPALLFREAVRRQSRVDRAAFTAAAQEMPGELLPRPQLPWSWADGSSCDVFWMNGLVETCDEREECRLAEAYADHWAEGYMQAEHSVSAAAFAGARAAPQKKLRGRSGLFRSRTFSTATNITTASCPPSGAEALVPVAFGRPDFVLEIQAIGKAQLDKDINVYACGNGSLVESLGEVCKVCNERARAKNSYPKKPQRYIFRHEHFGGK